VATVEQRVKAMNEQRVWAWHAGKEILDRAAAKKRDLTAEEDAAFRRADDDITRLDKERQLLLQSEEARTELERTTEAYNSIATSSERADVDRRTQMTRDFFSGQGNVKAFN
jgi:hypothetical protein